jgi:chitodextrinase
MGYHYPPETDLAECRLCDAHADGFIDLKDYARLALNWLNSSCGEGNSWCYSSDFNFDTQVDYEDLMMLNECWLAEDTGAPIPDPSKWQTVPYITEDGDANMVAKESIDEWGWDIEYYFECTTDPNRSSGWIAENSYLDTALEPGTQYEYKVRVRDAIGNTTGWSTSEYVITSVDPGPDAADPPTWVIPPEAVDSNSIFMQASGGDGTLQYTDYYFQRSDVETFDANTAMTGWQDPNSWTDTGLDPNTTYWYRVRAIDENGKVTDWSTVEYETTLPEGQGYDGTPPAPDPSLTAVEWLEGGYYYEAVEVSNAGNISDESPPIEYKFICYNNNGYSSDWITEPRYYVLVSTIDNKNYSWQVKARDAQGNETGLSELVEALEGPKPDWVPANP